jgi:hypothetical protein
MIISVINHSKGLIKDEELERAIRAINRQIAEDFEPYWSFGATLRLEGRSRERPSKRDPAADMRGEAVIYVFNQADVKEGVSHHDKNYRGIPYGFVFAALSSELGEQWSVTLSHEALEMVADPENNLYVLGPHPDNPKLNVFHWYEMCDAVQTETYEIDQIEVSNFVLPLYFTSSDEKGGRNDFLSRAYKGKTLKSFGINPGGYTGFVNPNTGKDRVKCLEGDKKAQERLKAKLQTQTARVRRRQSFSWRRRLSS